MNFDISIIISALALIVSAFCGFKATKHTDVKEIETRAAENARLNAKLDVVLNNIADIKDEIKRDRVDITTLDVRLTRVEESMKSAHKRIDTIEGRVNEE